MLTPSVAAVAGSVNVTTTSDCFATPAFSPRSVVPATATPFRETAAGPRSAFTSSIGYWWSARAAALNVISRGSVCVDAGGTVAHPQLIRRVPPAAVGYRLSFDA